MAGNPAGFVAVACACCLATYCVPRRLRWVWWLVCSWALYGWAAGSAAVATPPGFAALGLPAQMPAFVPACVLLSVCTLASWGFALLAYRARAAVRVVFTLCGLGVCLGLWAACKYLGLLDGFTLVQNGVSSQGGSMALPLGLSIYSVQAAGYAADVGLGRAIPEKNPLRHAVFLAFFPCVLAGPINRASALGPQLRLPAPFCYSSVAGGLFRVLWGFFKICVVAGGLYAYTEEVFCYPGLYGGAALALGVVLFCCRVYAGFSGLCDMAVGAARMMGLVAAENFARPFMAGSLAVLWQRWHSSLVGLLRDCIVAPLQKSRPGLALVQKGGAAAGVVPFVGTVVVFVLLGAWHGLHTGFLLWGLATGFLVATSAAAAPLRDAIAAKVPIYRARAVRGTMRRVFTLALFCAAMALFVCGVYQLAPAAFFPRFAVGWTAPELENLFANLQRAGFGPAAFAAPLGGLALVLGVEAFAQRGGASVAAWIRARRFYIRWPLYYLLLAGIWVFGVFPAVRGIYAGF